MLRIIKKGGAGMAPPFQSFAGVDSALGFFLLLFGFFLLEADFIFSHKSTKFGIIVLLAIERIV